MSKVMVIGSNSFSGASFVDFALQQGCDVIGVSRSQEPILHKVWWLKVGNNLLIGL